MPENRDKTDHFKLVRYMQFQKGFFSDFFLKKITYTFAISEEKSSKNQKLLYMAQHFCILSAFNGVESCMLRFRVRISEMLIDQCQKKSPKHFDFCVV